MHDNIMNFQLIPVMALYLTFLAGLDWVKAENVIIRK